MHFEKIRQILAPYKQCPYYFIESPEINDVFDAALKMIDVVDAAEDLTGGWDYNHDGWELDIKLLKALQSKVNALLENKND